MFTCVLCVWGSIVVWMVDEVHLTVEVSQRSSHLIPRIVTVPDHKPIVWHILVGFTSGAIATRQPPKRHSEVLTDERVYKRIDGWIYPTYRDEKKITINNIIYVILWRLYCIRVCSFHVKNIFFSRDIDFVL